MPKAFFLEPGLLARCDGIWYEPGILMVVEPGDRVEIFAAREGSPGLRKAHYLFRQLDTKEPPPGLRGDWRGLRRAGLPRRPGLLSRLAPRRRDEWAGLPAVA